MRFEERLWLISPIIDRITSQGEYGIADFKNGVILLEKGATSNPELMAGWLEFRQEIDWIISS